MKKQSLCLTFMLLFAAVSSSAQTVWGCGNDGKTDQTSRVVATLQNGTLTIRGIGPMKNNMSYSPWHQSRSEITAVIIEDGVTHIGDNAFYKCNLKEAHIASTVTTIGQWAFEDCILLETIEIPDRVVSFSISVFRECFGLREVKFLGNMPTFGTNTFLGIPAVTLYYPCGSTGWENYNAASNETILPFGTFTVSFNNDSETITQNICPNNTIAEPDRPEKANHVFDGWYKDSLFTERFNFSTPVTKNLSLYAKWTAYWDCSEAQDGSIAATIDDEGTLIISGHGKMMEWTVDDVPWKPYNNEILKIIINDSLTSLSGRAFVDCENLTTVVNRNKVPQLINANVFSPTALANINLSVPICAKQSYQAVEVWNLFGSITVFNTEECMFDSIAKLNTANLNLTTDTIRLNSEIKTLADANAKLKIDTAEQNRTIEILKDSKMALVIDTLRLSNQANTLIIANNALKVDTAELNHTIADLQNDKTALIADTACLLEQLAICKESNRDNSMLLDIINNLKTDTIRLNGEVHQLTADKQTLQDENSILEQDNTELNSEISTLTTNNDALKIDTAALNKEVSTLTETNDALKTDTTDLKAKITDLQDDKVVLIADTLRLFGQLTLCEENSGDNGTLLDMINDLKNDTATLNAHIAELNNEAATLTKSKKGLEADTVRLNAEVATLIEANEALKIDTANLNDEVGLLTESKEVLKADTVRLNAEMEMFMKANDALKADTTELNAEIADLHYWLALCEEGDNGELYDIIDGLKIDVADLNAHIATLQGLLADCGDEEQVQLLQDSLAWLNQVLAECENPNIVLQPMSDTDIKVFPNPVVAKLYIRILNNFDGYNHLVELYDMTGKRVYLGRIPTGATEFTIDMATFRTGHYILRIGNRMTKIIKN
ncbi:MAG: leucine-rich repeat protein [Bacteroidales bacterium]|jgi:uncharacterized repeat protein (TIGR02543 family)|nr:leucine-rich repeat protein [Bacteroidales bacterium]